MRARKKHYPFSSAFFIDHLGLCFNFWEHIYIYIYKNFITREHDQNAHEFRLWAMQDKQHGFIGINLFAYWLVPLTNTTEDAIASQRAMDFLIGW
jgi:hypothetical protein